MARTNFNGPVSSENGFIQELVTSGDVADATSAINTKWKIAGKVVGIIGSGLMYTAQGPLPTDPWYGSDNTSNVTPA